MAPCLGGKVRELCRHEILRPVVACQGRSCGGFALPLAVGGRCVEIVHAMSDGKVYKAVNLFLVEDIDLLAILFLFFGRPAHTTVT